MKVIYTGKEAVLAPPQQRKLEAKFAKLGKLLDRRGEKEAHVIITSERHLHKAEITVSFYDRSLVGVHADSDLLLALTGAIDRIEKQFLKQRERWRDLKRAPEQSIRVPREAAPAVETKPAKPARAARKAAPAEAGEPRVYRVKAQPRRKPMTLDEALLEIESERDYLVYRDAETDRMSVLIKREDGHFDLVES